MKDNENLFKISLSLDLFSKMENFITTSLLYSPSRKKEKYNLFDKNFSTNNLDGVFKFDTTYIENPIGTALIEFLNYNFDNFSDYFVYFTKYFGFYYDSMNYNQRENFERNTGLPDSDSNVVVSIAKEFYKKEHKALKYTQKSFLKAVQYIYNLNNNTELKDLTFKQRFYIFLCTKNDFIDLNKKIDSIYDFAFKYPNEFYFNLKGTEKELIKRIKKYDPHGTKIMNSNYYESAEIFPLLYIALYHLTFITDTYIRQCKNCNRYFLTSKSNTVYCENIFSGTQTCRDIGNQLSQQKKQNNEPVYGKYRKIYAKKAMLLKRNPDIYSVEDFENWKKTAQKFRKDIKNGKKTYEDFDKWLNTH